MCSVCSKEPSHRDGSFEYPQQMFGLRSKKLIFSYTVIWRPADLVTCKVNESLVSFASNLILLDFNKHQNIYSLFLI